MGGLSNNAFVVMAVCGDIKRTFGITVDCIGHHRYSFMWAFKIDREKAHREGYDATSVNGQVDIDVNYPGCPYCGNKNFCICGNCNTVICYHGERSVICPSCGFKGEVIQVENVNLKGGSM